jgi:hypothetical protein
MKIFTSSQVPSVIGIIIVCLVISNIIFDRIPHNDQNVTISSCDPATTLNFSGCQNVAATIKQTGWPFLAVSRYEYDNTSYSNYQKNPYAIPLDNNNVVYLSLNGDLLILLSLSAYILYKRHRLAIDDLIPNFTDAAADTDGPLISSSDMLNADGLISLGETTFNNFAYNILWNDDKRVMMFIRLHGNTNLHLVAIGDHSRLSLPLTEKIKSKYLTPVSLEGDFPDYFHLYCTPDKQIEIREIMEPASMAFFVDFCRMYDFEIFDDELYISQANIKGPQVEQATLAKDGENLLRHIGTTLDQLAKSVNESAA